MNFDFGEVLTHAWKITWKHKVLWLISILPFLTMFLILPIWLIFVFQENAAFDRISAWMQEPVFISIAVAFYVIMFATSIILQIVSRSSLTLGVYRAETVGLPITFVDLVQNGFSYFWRLLGIAMLIAVGMIAVFLAFFAVMAALSVVTMGLAAICLQPLFLLMIPLSLLVTIILEQSESAIVADDMKVMDALKRAYELIKSNFWKYMLITLVVYFGMNILATVVVFPLMLPTFFFMTQALDAGLDFNHMLRMQAVFGVVMVPLMALVQGFSLTYTKSAMVVTYLRLTRSSQLPPLPQFVEATS